ncbi:hypothetical protein psyc5s11_16260 [Clostridium gelidum]|uniref:Transposase n=1 Tax=Clostridium gelidum TaxID=704125 RepID=A0ABM7T9C5_9CLOT|nr:hypothetical protein psyc5s11_16260 [Clostridium gelidum]
MIKNNIIPIHQIGFQISFENIIPNDDSVRMLYDVMEGLDYTELNRTYSSIGRNPAVLPETMFAVIVYGKGNRKSKLQKYTELLNEFIDKQSKYDEYNSICCD